MYRAAWLVLALVLSLGTGRAQGGIHRVDFSSGALALSIELLDDDLAHFELRGAADGGRIWSSPMVARIDYDGPSAVTTPSANVIETPALRLTVDEATLCVTADDLARTPPLMLTTICPGAPDSAGRLTLAAAGTTDVYGLGEHFQRRGGADGNWFGKRRVSLNLYGNALVPHEGAGVGSAQFPVMYALGDGSDGYAFFLDDVYQQTWDFSGDPFVVETVNDVARWYLMTGPDLRDLRADYLELTGRPPVPPKQMFGLWISEYGYENWAELESVLESMRREEIPLDGFLLDLQWFGGIGADSRMGALRWDEANFPQPAATIARLRDQHGLGIMTIEEPYVAATVPDYDAIIPALVHVCRIDGCEPAHMSSWWGSGGMIDWTSLSAAAWWHDTRRQPLIDDGIIGHWTDLGEPEDFDPRAWYAGIPELGRHAHADIHNLYNLFWTRSIWDGYARNRVERRPFVLSRSGTSGIQRYGAAMWSGDIAANMTSLAAHMNAQMHMSLSGIDYFGADIGGFQRQIFDPVLGVEAGYTRWLANAVLLDVPLRPHAMNLQNLHQTAPSLIGDVTSNRANVRLRYELGPYLYTLAHRAWRDGEAIFPPPVYHHQADPNLRTIGSQKMIGPDLMMATLTGYSTASARVYLPAGGWYNFHTNEYYESAGEWVDAPIDIDTIQRAPLFVRAGAIVPTMPVDHMTLNMLGRRADGSTAHDLIIRVYAGADGDFTLIEDDGETMAYRDGALRQTRITQRGGVVSIGAAVGSYDGAPQTRRIGVRYIMPDGRVESRVVNADAGATYRLEFEE